jgi:hypothetical protein
MSELRWLTLLLFSQLLKKLRKVNESLKGFAHVNKKAYEQYTSFTKQRDDLLARQEELDKSQESILELIDVLDARKDEAIERTFKQVAKNFEEVFEKLVSSGRGRLIMLKRTAEKVRFFLFLALFCIFLLSISDPLLPHRMTTIWTSTSLRRKAASRTTPESPFESRSSPSRTKGFACSSSRVVRRPWLLSLWVRAVFSPLHAPLPS